MQYEIQFESDYVHIIESLERREYNTAESIRQFLKIWNVRVEVSSIESKSEFVDLLDQIRTETKMSNKPLLHIEIHGSKSGDGLSLRNKDVVPWEEFRQMTQKININSGNNLFLFMAVCSGGLFANEFKQFDECAPMFGIIGPRKAVYNTELEDLFKAVYGIIFSGDTNKLPSLLESKYPNYLMKTADEVFFWGFRDSMEMFLRQHSLDVHGVQVSKKRFYQWRNSFLLSSLTENSHRFRYSYEDALNSMAMRNDLLIDVEKIKGKMDEDKKT